MLWCCLLAWEWGVGDVRVPRGSCRLVKAYLDFRKVATISDSAAEDMTVLMSCHRV